MEPEEVKNSKEEQSSTVVQDLSNVTDIKQLSPQCQKAVRRFKSWLKRHVGENYENVMATHSVFSDLSLHPSFKAFCFSGGNLSPLNLDWSIKTARSPKSGYTPLQLMFNSFATTHDVSWEESEKALKLMAEKNFYYLPKIKVTLSGKKKVDDAGKSDESQE